MLGKLRYQRQEASRQRVWYQSPWEPERHLCDLEKVSTVSGDSPWRLYGTDGTHLINGASREEAVKAFFQYAGDNGYAVAQNEWRARRSLWCGHMRYTQIPAIEALPSEYLGQLYTYLDRRLTLCRKDLSKAVFMDCLALRNTGRTVLLVGSSLCVTDCDSHLGLDASGLPRVHANVEMFEDPNEASFLLSQLNGEMLKIHAEAIFPAPYLFPEPLQRNPYSYNPRF